MLPKNGGIIMFKKIKSFSSVFVMALVAISFFVNLSFFADRAVDQPKTVGVTVFVHGTVGAGLTFVGRGMVARFRSHPLVQQEQIIGKMGFHEFDAQKSDVKEAVTFIIPAYDAIAHHVGFAHDINKYVVFGWSGVLTQDGRKKAGFELYDALCLYRDQLRFEYGVEPIIRLVTHSHGGNVALWLPCAEEEKKQNLTVDMLYMLAPPVQVETAPFVESTLFKSLMLGWSSSDRIQPNDYLSTKNWKSYMHMSALIDLDGFVLSNPGYQRCDMRFVVDEQSNRIGHANMWLFGRDNRVLPGLDHLPLLVFIPAFAQAALSDSSQTCYTAHLDGDSLNCCTYLKNSRDDVRLGLCGNYCSILEYHEAHAVQAWGSTDKNRSLVFNKKNLKALPYAFFGWMCKS